LTGANDRTRKTFPASAFSSRDDKKKNRSGIPLTVRGEAYTQIRKARYEEIAVTRAKVSPPLTGNDRIDDSPHSRNNA